MQNRMLGFTAAVVFLGVATVSADPILQTTVFNADFTASQSLWSGGPTAGLDKQGRTGGDVGLYYSVKANTGTVDATQNAGIRATYLTETMAGAATAIGLTFVGDTNGGVVGAKFGANAETGVFLDISGCVGGVVLGTCVGVPYNIDTDIPVIDEGFFLEPTTTHTPVVDVQRSANDAAAAFGVGGLDVVIGTLGPTMNLDLDQNIFFRPTGLTGIALYQNSTATEAGFKEFTIPTAGPSNLQLDLGPGLWNITFANIALVNTFRNDINLELRPAFDYIVGSWPAPGSGPFSFDLIDETFALNFNRIGNLGTIQVAVVDAPAPAPVPEPGSLALLMLGAGALVLRRLSREDAAKRLPFKR